MSKNYNTNSSIFSQDYKIPYEQSRIAEHLQESQSQLNFLKLKLTQAYEKLEEEIKGSTELEETIDIYELKAQESEQKYMIQRKENAKLKQTLEVILKNRRIMQQEIQEVQLDYEKKLDEKEKQFQFYQNQLKLKNNKIDELIEELDFRTSELKQLKQKAKDDAYYRDKAQDREFKMNAKINLLENQIKKLTDEKFIEVNRLRHQLQLYQRSQGALYDERMCSDRREPRQRCFSRVNRRFDSNRTNYEDELNFDKENISFQPSTMMQQNMLQSNVSNEESHKKSHKNQSTEVQSAEQQKEASMMRSVALTDDEKLTKSQNRKKEVQLKLNKMDKIKRPSPQEQKLTEQLQKEIYGLNSDIAGLKRKIRRKY